MRLYFRMAEKADCVKIVLDAVSLRLRTKANSSDLQFALRI